MHIIENYSSVHIILVLSHCNLLSLLHFFSLKLDLFLLKKKKKKVH